MPESPRRAGRPRGPSDPSAICPEELVEHMGPRTQARVTRDGWATPRSLRPEPESPGTPGRPGGTSGPGPRRPGQQVDRGPLDPNSSRLGEWVDTAGTRALAEWARESWQTPQDPGHGPESPKTSGRPRGQSDTSARTPGMLVNPVGSPTEACVARVIWSNPWALGHGPVSPGAGRRAGIRARPVFFRDACSTPRALRPGPKSPGAADPCSGTSGTGPRRLGQLVDHGTWDPNRVARESLWTPRALEHRPESPNTGGRTRGP